MVQPARPQRTLQAHALNTQGYKHTIRICKSYYFSTATMITGTRLNVTLYLNRLSSFFKKRHSLTLSMAFIYRLKEFITTLSAIRLNQHCQGYYMTIFPCFNVLPKWPFIFLQNGVFGFFFGVIWKFIVFVSCCYLTIYSFFYGSKCSIPWLSLWNTFPLI
jgi:hypothetical protein